MRVSYPDTDDQVMDLDLDMEILKLGPWTFKLDKEKFPIFDFNHVLIMGPIFFTLQVMCNGFLI